MGCPRKQSQRKMFLGNDFFKKCKPKKAGAVTKGSKAGKPKAKSTSTRYISKLAASTCELIA